MGITSRKPILEPVFASESSVTEYLGGPDDQLRDRARTESTPTKIGVSLDGHSLVPAIFNRNHFT